MSDETTPTPTSIVSRLREGSLSSRRRFLTRSAEVSAGALALAIVGSNTALAHDAASDDVSDVDVLNYALTLEHLENAFYRVGRDRFAMDDYMRSKTLRRFGNSIRGSVVENLTDIGEHERVHVETLTAVVQDLGGTPVDEACYDFGVDDADDFLAVAALLENTGVSAYDGAIALIDNAELITAGATIATVEARHASYLNLLTGADPFPASFDDPKTMQEILDAAGGFIVDCE